MKKMIATFCYPWESMLKGQTGSKNVSQSTLLLTRILKCVCPSLANTGCMEHRSGVTKRHLIYDSCSTFHNFSFTELDVNPIREWWNIPYISVDKTKVLNTFDGSVNLASIVVEANRGA